VTANITLQLGTTRVSLCRDDALVSIPAVAVVPRLPDLAEVDVAVYGKARVEPNPQYGLVLDGATSPLAPGDGRENSGRDLGTPPTATTPGTPGSGRGPLHWRQTPRRSGG